MQILAVGNKPRSAQHVRGSRGFTLLELLVVLSIMALATVGVGLAMRDGTQAQLEREAERLAALLESARAQSRASGVPVRWLALPEGFRFDGLPDNHTLPTRWLDPATRVRSEGNEAASLVLGPEPLIGRQQVTLTLSIHPEQTLRVTTDGLRPFAVEAVQ
ncbi:MAG: prepilin-type N-terminal cleavage/methylation domain-containing protein [Giesbergeria sp.]|nr:prepilin-type N-terminal cleavage/methylation domain-containing protein [Giesbergeria sp.]